jgi:hypothetical protein
MFLAIRPNSTVGLIFYVERLNVGSKIVKLVRKVPLGEEAVAINLAIL